ncbi:MULTISPECIES: metal ABC transporter substrate-binding protein [Arcanobacterium]|uniref:Zinc ABC transporter substrate-binding protein n=1 Tax=Arcanobacterium bovis TaxID=2529275 RepID=A0A4Q9V0I1_9ACTO|nr:MULTISPECIES: metal ABC transporter substrate-binding protein [Arcanobacterium]MBM7825708.1 manganese/zinc/iron transport system substrate-binding protein [Arcanobacterium pluranimalium]TBW20946.1 zinc ABC transporter substrate-binding protein [Arcanobacterium bovis]
MRRKFKRSLALITASLMALAVSACSTGEKSKDSMNSGAKESSLRVFATTGYLADAVSNIAPGAKVYTMVKPGGDPHTYQPSTKDIEELNAADAVVWNGLHLEALMTKQLQGMGKKQIAVGDQLPKDKLLPWPEKDDAGHELHDPHIWNSPENWQLVVEEVAKHLGKLDPKNADQYLQNAKSYNKKIDEADAQAKKVLSSIPADQRNLVTGHDAFNYLGKRYNLQIFATDFVTSEAEKSASELNDLAQMIATKKIKTIFVDNLQNPQAVKSLQENVKSKGWDVKISDEELFADSLGDKEPVNTYLGVLKHNTEAIAKGLGNK